jgi:hypothetical protein
MFEIGELIRPIADHRALQANQIYKVVGLEDGVGDSMVMVRDFKGNMSGGWYATRFERASQIDILLMEPYVQI